MNDQETDETSGMTTLALQRLVLREQLKLARLQILKEEMIIAKLQQLEEIQTVDMTEIPMYQSMQ